MARQLILFVHTTLNGVVTGDPASDKEEFGSQWAKQGNLAGEASATLVRLFERADTILLGRGTFDALSSRWPQLQGSEEGDDVTRRLAERINTAHKVVVSRSPGSVDVSWGGFEPATAIHGTDLAAQVRALKRSAGGDIVVFGSPVLVRTLLEAELIDEFFFVIHPVLIAVGERLFDGIESRTDLELRAVTALEEGGVLVSYQRSVATGRSEEVRR